MGEKEQVFQEWVCWEQGEDLRRYWVRLDIYGIYLVGKGGNVQVRAESWFEAQEKGKGWSSRSGIVIMWMLF